MTRDRSCYRRAVRLLIVAACFAACGKSGDDTVAAVNALVAVKHQYKLHFVERELTTGDGRTTFSLPVPKEWKIDHGTAAPVDTIKYGESSISVMSSCEIPACPLGEKCETYKCRPKTCTTSRCTSEDWYAFIDEEHLSPLLDVVRDEKEPHGRVVVTRFVARPETTVVSVYSWEDNGQQFYMCEARVAPGSSESLAAFEKACRSMRVHR